MSEAEPEKRARCGEKQTEEKREQRQDKKQHPALAERQPQQHPPPARRAGSAPARHNSAGTSMTLSADRIGGFGGGHLVRQLALDRLGLTERKGGEAQHYY